MTGTGDTAGLDRRLADALVRLGHGLRSSARRTAQEHGLSLLQQNVLLALDRLPRERHEVAALAAEFDVTTSTMSSTGTALERKGLVTRSPAADRRRRVLSLTEAGAEVAHVLSARSDPLMAALAGIREQDRTTTLHTLLRVIADMQRTDPAMSRDTTRGTPDCR
ncbi:MarR family winged helix-turn-helix transcriptional regulator [Lentzea sp. NPDC060358]|uniref:MarR family winged helix-turn-helix transcriptional regulator n=1 Tax=Lentzea sp. NPDC060358 TaxID=3347103 RepID=UPI003651A035